MAFNKEQVKNISANLLKNLLLNRFGKKGSGFSRPFGPPIRASRPFYKIECWISDVDLSLNLHKIQMLNSTACAYPVFFLELSVEAKDYILERIYGEENLILSIIVTDANLTDIENNIFELVIIDIKSDMSAKNQDEKAFGYNSNRLKLTCLIKEPYVMMTSPVNMLIEPKSAGTGSQSKPLGKFGAPLNKITGFIDSIGNKIEDTLGSMMGAVNNLTDSFSSVMSGVSNLTGNIENLTGGMDSLINSFTGMVPSNIMDSANLIQGYVDNCSNITDSISGISDLTNSSLSNIGEFTNGLVSGELIDINANPNILFNSVEKISSLNENVSGLYSNFSDSAVNLNLNISNITSQIDTTKNLILDLPGIGDFTDYSNQIAELDSLKNITTDALLSNENVIDKLNKSSVALDSFDSIIDSSKQKFSDISLNLPDIENLSPISGLDFQKLKIQNNTIQSIVNSVDINTINKISMPSLVSEVIKINPTQFSDNLNLSSIGNFTSNLSTTLNSNLNIDIATAFDLNSVGLFGSGLSGNNPFSAITSNLTNSRTSKYAEKTPVDYATRLAEIFLKGVKININKKNKNEDKLEQITIPPMTFNGAIRYLNDMYSIFRGPMFSYFKWEDNTYCLWDLSKAIEMPEDYTVEFFTYGQDTKKVLKKSKPNTFWTFNPLNVKNSGNKAIGSQSHSQIFIKKDLHEFSKKIQTNIDDLSQDLAGDQDKKVTYNTEFKNRKRVYSKGITGGPKNCNHYQLKNKIIKSISNSSTVSFELTGDATPITRLSRIGGSIKINCHVPEYVQYGGKYIVYSSLITIKRTQQMKYEFKCLVNCFRGNIEI